MDFKARLGARLRETMGLRRLSQRAIGEHMGVHQTQVGKWVRGVNAPSVEQLCRLAVFLDVPVAYLIGEAIGSTRSDPTDEERAVIELVRALGLSGREAMRRLATPTYDVGRSSIATPLGSVDLSDLPQSPPRRTSLERETEGKPEPPELPDPPSRPHVRRRRS